MVLFASFSCTELKAFGAGSWKGFLLQPLHFCCKCCFPSGCRPSDCGMQYKMRFVLWLSLPSVESP